MSAALERVKLDRHCPRCHFHGYHFARRFASGTGQRGGIRNDVEIDCCNCGHRWMGRFKREEWQ